MISVVIPAYNEEYAVADTISGITTAMADMGCDQFEILVVDDGSSDGTGDAAKKAGAKVMRKPQNIGYGHSLKIGIREATYDTIVITDADGTYPVDKIPELVKRYNEGFNMVVGARTGPHYRGSAIKGPLRLILKFLVEFATGRSIPDANSGLRVFSRIEAMAFFNQLSDGFSFTTSITLGYMLKKKYVSYIEIPYMERIGKSKVRTFRDSIRTIFFIIGAIVYYTPLKLFLLLSFLLLSIGCLSLLVGLFYSITTTIMFGIGCILVSLIIFSMGLLANFLRQIMISAEKE